MNKKIITVALGLLSISFSTQAQVGVNIEKPNATLDIVKKTNNGTEPEGVLIPRMSADELKTMTDGAGGVGIGENQHSMLVYVEAAFTQSTNKTGKYEFVDTPGYYYFDYNKTSQELSRWKKLLNNKELLNIYTADGNITGKRTVTLKNDTSNITFSKEGSVNTNPLIIVEGTIKATAYNLNSDARLKDQIKELSSKNIDELRAVSYIWNKKGKEWGGNDALQYGFIAQEIEKVYPNLVITDEEGYKSVNYIQIIPILTKAIQEERAINEKQQSLIEQQARELKELKELVQKIIAK